MKKSHLGLFVGVCAGVALAVYAYLRLGESGFEWREFLAVLGGMNRGWMALAVPLAISTYLIRAIRWGVLLRPIAPDASIWRLMSATCIGFTAVVLFGRAGEAVRPYLISKREGVSLSSQLAAWVVERMLDMIMVLLVFGIALTQVENSGLQPGPRMRIVIETGGWLAGVVGAISLAALIAIRQYQGNAKSRIVDGLGFLPDTVVLRIQNFMTAFGEGMKSTREGAYAGHLVFYTVLLWGVIAASFYCVFQAFPELNHLRFTDVVITLGFVAFGSVLQLPGVGGGIQIAAVVVFTELYRVSLETASGVALVLWALSFIVVVPLGLAMAFHEGVKWRNMKQVGDDSSGFGM